MLTSNNYLGFANHPRIREAPKKALDRWGAGLGSVRFICGTQQLHKDLEADDRDVLRDARTRSSTCPAGTRTRASSRRPRRGGRPLLRRAQPRLDHRRRPPLQGEAVPRAARRPRRPREDARGRPRRRRYRLFITDGVFSMEGEELADPPRVLADLARRTTRSSSSTTPTRPGSSERPGAARPRSRESTGRCRSRPARSARRWARRPAASSRGRRRSSTSCASGRGRRSSRTRCRRRSPAGSLEAFRHADGGSLARREAPRERRSTSARR